MATETTHATIESTLEEAGGISGVIHTFGVRGDLFAAQLLNFLIVLAVLWKFAYKPIMKILHDREETIAESLKNAERIEKRLEEATAEKEAVMAEARKEAQALILKANEEMEKRKVEMSEAAKKEVARIIEKGKEELEAQQAAMLMEARKDLVEIAVKAAAKILTEGMDEKKSKSLAEEVVRKLT